MYEIDSTERVFTPSPIGDFETPSPAGDNDTPAPVAVVDTPAPVAVGDDDTPAPVEVVAEGNYIGCYLDTKDERIMTKTETASPMSSLVSLDKSTE